jgi:hypothetical protein
MTAGAQNADKKVRTLVAKDPSREAGTLKLIGGSASDDWNNTLANQTINTLWVKHSDEQTVDRQFKAATAALIGIGPRDELEGMLAAQMIAAHSAAMECYRRAMLGEQSFEGRRENLNQANKLSRTYSTLLEALNRHRGKGQQKVRVEHVHVHSGGQAVVGVVEEPGGRGDAKSEDQSHARPTADAPEPKMRSENSQRLDVPGTSHAERAVPHARR